MTFTLASSFSKLCSFQIMYLGVPLEIARNTKRMAVVVEVEKVGVRIEEVVVSEPRLVVEDQGMQV